MRPLDLGFELTNLCNLHCNHCIRGSHQDRIDRLEMPFIRQVLDQASAIFSPLAIVMTGGEPLASEIFPDMVEELRLRNLPYRFATNGWLIPRHLPALVRHAPSFVRISLSGGRAETHDAERGSGSFERALLGAAALLANGIRTELSMVITTDSRSEIRDAATIASQLGVAELHFILPQPTPETAIARTDLSPTAWQEVSLEVYRLSRDCAVPIRLDYGAYLPYPRPLCNTMSLLQVYVDAQGRVPFCCQLSRYGTGDDPIIGDLTAEPLAAIVARAEVEYTEFAAETAKLHQIGRSDSLDEYPCLSCARRHGKTKFLADFPEHPWVGLARSA
jgi:MoaA/NifB/PqqE/SkfB family radical SAM enzyme